MALSAIGWSINKEKRNFSQIAPLHQLLVEKASDSLSSCSNIFACNILTIEMKTIFIDVTHECQAGSAKWKTGKIFAMLSWIHEI